MANVQQYPTREVVWAQVVAGKVVTFTKSVLDDHEVETFAAFLEDTLEEGEFEVLGVATLH